MKKRIVLFLCVLVCALIIFFNSAAADAARSGFSLWQNVLLPSLLPFFVCSSLMQAYGGLRLSEPFSLFAVSFVSGAPSGARIFGELGADEELTALAAPLNVISPVFVYGAYCSSMLGRPEYAKPILLGQLLSAAACFFFAYKKSGARLAAPSRSLERPAGLAGAIADAVASMLSICGTVVFFSVLAALLKETGALRSLAYPFGALTGDMRLSEAMALAILEVVTGSSALAGSGAGAKALVSASAFAFSFGGLCVGAQSALFMKIKAGKYFLIKLAQGALSAAIAWLAFPLFCAGTWPVSAPLDTALESASSSAAIFASSLFAMGLVMILSVLCSRGAKTAENK